MERLNMNSTVKVRLNDKGQDIYYHINDKYYKKFNIKRRFKETDKDGYSEFQLWQFMNIYGEHLKLGSDNPFSDLNIYIKDEDLETV